MSSFVIKMDDIDEIPKGCGYCPLEYDCMECIITGTSHYWPREGRNISTLEERHKNCPFVCVLPEEHGRLVDAKRIEYELCEGNLPKRYCDFIRRVLNSENLTPTIVPAERSAT